MSSPTPPSGAGAPGPDAGATSRELVQAATPRPSEPPAALAVLEVFGAHMQLLFSSLAWLVRRPFRPRLFFEQMEFVGVGSLPIVMLVGLFTGAVSALQAVLALGRFQQERWAGFGVGIALAQDLAPVFTALMISARAGSGMATELGSMRITEQIDALTTFAVSPVQYLVTPRVVASIIMLPVMTIVFNVVGLVGAYIVLVVQHNVDFGQLAALFQYWVDPIDYVKGLIKAAIFGIALSLAACYQGLNVRGGAKEVGRATTRAVVTGAVSVLVLDYFLISILSSLWPFLS